MLVQIKKGSDSRPTLACVRADGTRTWRKVHPFFPLHDITHYAVESILGLRQAFFGLVASGWTLEAFEAPATRTAFPPEALFAEQVVGIFDLERGLGRLLTAAEFNEALVAALGDRDGITARALTDTEIMAVRTLRGTLQARWQALMPGETLEIAFPAGAGSTGPP